MDETCYLIQNLHNTSKILEFVWIPKAHSSVDRPMKNFNFVDSRGVVGRTVKIWEISGVEKIFGCG